MKQRFIFAISIIFSVFLFASCTKDDDSEMKELELRILDNYLESNNITVEPTASGLYFIEEKKGTGFVSPSAGDWVNIHYSIYSVDGEIILSTTRKSVADDNDFFNENYLYGPAKLPLPSNVEGLNEGLRMMTTGGKARLIFPSDLGYGSRSFQGVPGYTSLIIDVELLEIIENPIQRELDLIEDYLVANNFPDDTTESGLYYIEMEEGVGDSAVFGSTATVNVKGSILGGPQFMNESSLRLLLNVINEGITLGLQEGILYMKEGGVARLIVPWYIGFGQLGFGNSTSYVKGPIPPYSTLVYDVEMIEWD
jgi:FKBP-type peptidyl-prolyl cis-trans isomerase FkpA